MVARWRCVLVMVTGFSRICGGAVYGNLLFLILWRKQRRIGLWHGERLQHRCLNYLPFSSFSPVCGAAANHSPPCWPACYMLLTALPARLFLQWARMPAIAAPLLAGSPLPLMRCCALQSCAVCAHAAILPPQQHAAASHAPHPMFSSAIWHQPSTRVSAYFHLTARAALFRPGHFNVLRFAALCGVHSSPLRASTISRGRSAAICSSAGCVCVQPGGGITLPALAGSRQNITRATSDICAARHLIFSSISMPACAGYTSPALALLFLLAGMAWQKTGFMAAQWVHRHVRAVDGLA